MLSGDHFPQQPVHTSILHVDMDAFYVSVELLKRPDLRGKPVIVGGSPDSRGVVCSASYEARKFGVHSAMPCFKAAKLCPQAIFLNGEYALYGQYSKQIRSIFQDFTPLVEMASQDEAYLDLTGTERLWGSPLKAAQKLRDRVVAETHLPCSIGIGPNRLVAKIASDLCKPRGLLWIPKGSEAMFMSNLPIRKIPGVGKEAEKKLSALGIKEVRDYLRLNEQECRSLFGDNGLDLRRRCLGQGSTRITPVREAKSVSNETTFDIDKTDESELLSVLSFLSEKVADRLRVKKRQASTIGIKLKYADFKVTTAAQTLSEATHDDRVIFSIVQELFRTRFRSGEAIRLVGVVTSNLTMEDEDFGLFSEAEENQEQKRLHSALDHIRHRYGFNSVGRGSSRKK